MEEQLFNAVFFKNGKVVGSQVFYEHKVEDVYSQLGSYERLYQSEEVVVFYFNEEAKSYEKLA